MLAALAWSTLHGSFERQPQPAPLYGRGLSGCAMRGTDFSLLNPAALAGLASMHITLFHSPSPFELPQLSSGGIALSIPAPFGTLQAAFTLSGTDLYREQTAMLSYALALDGAKRPCAVRQSMMRPAVTL